MKKKIAAILCLSMVAVGVAGCQEKARKSHGTVEVSASPTTTEADAKEATVTVTEKAKKISDVPISIDSAIPIEKGAHIAVVGKTTNSTYWKNLKSYMEEAVSYINQEYQFSGEDKITMTFEGPGEEEDVTAQINIIDAVLAENPTVLCLAAIDVNSCEAQLETARENGIPVIMFDSGVESSLAAAYVGTNNSKAGRTAADRLSEAIGGKGKVAVVAHEPVSQTCRKRVSGFRTRLENKYPKVKLQEILYMNEEESLEDMVRSLLESNKKLKGIFCTNGDVAEVVLDVLKEYPDRQIQMVGFDVGKAQKKAISQGIEYGTIVQDIYRMAYETIWAAARSTALDEGETLEHNLYIKHLWLDADNLEDVENMKNLYD